MYGTGARTEQFTLGAVDFHRSRIGVLRELLFIIFSPVSPLKLSKILLVSTFFPVDEILCKSAHLTVLYSPGTGTEQ